MLFFIKNRAPQHDDTYVVGIGASAGGLEAINELFDHVTDSNHVAFIVVQHLSSEYKSLLVELLAKHTHMPVEEARHRQKVEAGKVYVIPNNKELTIHNGFLMLAEKEFDKGPNTAIDTFFQSLAQDQREYAIAVVLSGTGTDGTRSIEAVKNCGGYVIVQDPETAKFDGMPKSAIASGYVDLVLAPNDIYNQIGNYIDGILPLKTPLSKKYNEYIQSILTTVYRKTGYDFLQYKEPTILRRITRRMQMVKMEDVESYEKYINTHDEEPLLLTREFFIGVTSFFRDKDAFTGLYREVIIRLVGSKENHDSLKIWVTACSTGQEAYTIAILIDKAMQQLKKQLEVKIFASDIDKTAIEFASKAQYQRNQLLGLEKKVLQDYFTEVDEGFCVISRIRKQVVFATHDILKDPPFIKNDLVTCRNLLIYLNPPLQENVLATLYFALNKGGFLFLGTSENPALLRKGFAEIDSKWKIYQRNSDQNVFTRRMQTSTRKGEGTVTNVTARVKTDVQLAEDFKKVLADKLGYAGVYINENYEIKEGIGNFKKYLSLPDKLSTLNILKMASPELAGVLSTALRKCLKENKQQQVKNVRVRSGEQQQLVDIFVYPPAETSSGIYTLVVLADCIIDGDKAPIHVQDMTILQKDQYVRQLEDELRETRSNLQMAVEGLETANEELQSSNEELQSANEELQSSNEELQSLNEELHTLNTEHQLRIKELVELNDDITNYLQTSLIGQIFLDQKLRIRRFNHAASAVINIIDNDIGRPIEHITHHIKDSTFFDDVKNVSKTGQVIEREIELDNGMAYLMRLVPYIRQDKVRDGLVIILSDITQRKEAEDKLRKNYNELVIAKDNLRELNNQLEAKVRERTHDMQSLIQQFRFVNDFMPQIVWAAGPDGYYDFYNQQWYDYTGLSYTDTKEKGWTTILHPDDYDRAWTNWQRSLQTGHPYEMEYRMRKYDGSYRWFLARALPLRNDQGYIIKWFGTCTDIHDQKIAERVLEDKVLERTHELRLLNERLEASNADLMQFASVASHDLKEPLRKIHFFSSLIREQFSEEINGNLAIYIDRISKASSRATSLINDVLSYSRLSSDNLFEQVDLNGVVQEILQDLELVIQEKGATLQVGRLPVIEAVAGQMRQLFQNILANSLKFHKPGQPPVITITCKTVDRAHYREFKDLKSQLYQISIKDEGIGFDEQYSRKIFSLFQRLNSKEKYEGTGIGLAIANKIIERHHGMIAAKGRENEGAEFIILLPEKQPDQRQLNEALIKLNSL